MTYILQMSRVGHIAGVCMRRGKDIGGVGVPGAQIREQTAGL